MASSHTLVHAPITEVQAMDCDFEGGGFVSVKLATQQLAPTYDRTEIGFVHDSVEQMEETARLFRAVALRLDRHIMLARLREGEGA